MTINKVVQAHVCDVCKELEAVAMCSNCEFEFCCECVNANAVHLCADVFAHSPNNKRYCRKCYDDLLVNGDDEFKALDALNDEIAKYHQAHRNQQESMLKAQDAYNQARVRKLASLMADDGANPGGGK